MITECEKWHYLAVKKLSALLRGITSKHEGHCYCLNCFRSYSTNLEIRNAHLEMPEKDNKILKYNHAEKSMKVLFIIYANLEFLPEKINTCHNNPEKLSTIKINKHTPSGYYCLHMVHLIQQKVSLIITELEIA